MVQFRIKALNQLQKPDDLDLLMKVTKMRGWIALGVLGAVVTGAIVWSFVGHLPSEVTAPGLLSKPQGVTIVESQISGQVTKVLYQDGTAIKAGHPIAEVQKEDGTTTIIRSKWGGQITGNPIDEGNFIEPGTPLMYIERSNVPNNRLLAFLFVDAGKADSIAPGMKVDLNVSAAPAAAFGVLRARVTSVEAYPATFQEVKSLLTDEQLAHQFTDNGPTTIVTVDLTKDPKTRTGYKWSTKKGPPFPIRSGIAVKGTVIQGTQAPIKLVFGK
jgi:multidrug resistance efflux pump